MAELFDYRDRQVVPIWRGFNEAIRSGELGPTIPKTEVMHADVGLAELLLDWKLRPGVTVASELVCTAWIMGLDSAAVDAAEYILKLDSAPPLARDIAVLYLRSSGRKADDESEAVVLRTTPPDTAPALDLRFFYLEISRTRHQLSQYSRNPVLWSKLSRLYTTLGEREKADRSMRVALAQAPENRYVLRAASRLYLHQGEGDRAHRLLLRSPRITTDPWILAAEIATASALGKTSGNIRKSRKVVDVGHHSPFHLSELASALGTLDAKSGNRKSSRKLVQFSLLAPSENSIAQADWLTRSKRLPHVEGINRSTSPEAIAWHSWARADWKMSIRAGRIWQQGQPFSSRPATFCSHLANEVLEDYDLAVQTAEFGLRSNEEDSRLRNNLAYALAARGDLSRALEEIKKAGTNASDPENMMFQAATHGFIAFRAGMAQIGRKFYNSAISAAEKNRFEKWAAVARLHLALEAMRAQESDAEQLKKEALDKASVLVEPWGHVLISRLERYGTERPPPGAGFKVFS